MRKPLTVFALLSGTFFVSGPVSSVSAATNEEIAQSLLEAAGQVLGVDITDPDLIEELTDGLAFAIEDGSIPQEIVDEIGNAIDSDTEPENLEEVLDVNIIDQITNWEEYAPEFRENFEEVRTEFQACREASANASECARGIGFKMQVASAEDSMTRIALLQQQLIDGSAELTQEELDAIAAEIAELTAKVERAEAKLAGLDESDPAVQEARNKMARIREGMAEMDESLGAQSDNSAGSTSGKGNANGGGKGNSNSNGNGNAGGKGNAGGNSNSNAGGNGKGKP